LNVALDAHIGALKNALTASRFNLLRRCAPSVSVDVRRDYFGAVLCEQQCDAFSNSHGCPGYESHAALQTHTFSFHEAGAKNLSQNPICVQRTIQCAMAKQVREMGSKTFTLTISRLTQQLSKDIQVSRPSAGK
jgi:hypothetical protein